MAGPFVGPKQGRHFLDLCRGTSFGKKCSAQLRAALRDWRRREERERERERENDTERRHRKDRERTTEGMEHE